MAIRIVAATAGIGDAVGDKLTFEMNRIVSELKPESYHPLMKTGLAGDIPSAVAEKESIMSEALWATLLSLDLFCSEL